MEYLTQNNQIWKQNCTKPSLKSIELTVLTVFFYLKYFFFTENVSKTKHFQIVFNLYEIVVKKVSNIENKYENVLEKIRK